jgi:hypothetical protein
MIATIDGMCQESARKGLEVGALMFVWKKLWVKVRFCGLQDCRGANEKFGVRGLSRDEAGWKPEEDERCKAVRQPCTACACLQNNCGFTGARDNYE